MQELIFIGVIALIVFGPRKLPQMARTLGKVMADFRKTTNDFKETWQKEVDFEEYKDDGMTKTIAPREMSIAANAETTPEQLPAPEIKEITAADFEKLRTAEPAALKMEKQPEKSVAAKENWL